MANIMNGRYVLADPSSGLTVFSLDGGKLNMFGHCTKIKAAHCTSYPQIDDEPVELVAKNSIKEKLLTGIAIAAVLAGVAIAVAVTGGAALAPLACALGGAAIGVSVVTVGTVASDSETGYNRSWEEYLEDLMIGGCIGFAAGASVYNIIAAGASMSLADAAFIKKIIPPIIIESGIIAGISGCGQKDKEIPVIDFTDLTGSADKEQDEEGLYLEQTNESDSIDESDITEDGLTEDETESSLTENPDYIVELEEDQRRLLVFPKTGEEITVSRGVDASPRYQQANVFTRDAWSREYTTDDYSEDKLTSEQGLFWRRIKYAMENYEYNDTDNDLLIFHLGGKYQDVFAGAMVNGYADIGDIVEVTLDDGNFFYFLILDVKNITHKKDELADNKQCQCEWGHGYMLSEKTVQLNPCEFMSTGKCRVRSAQDAPSGGFLKMRRVEKAETVAHIKIGEYTGN